MLFFVSLYYRLYPVKMSSMTHTPLFICLSCLILATNYSSVERLIRALKEGEVDYILVDMYLPVKRKDLFNGSWFEIAALYKAEISHGILLRGDALNLASALEEMIAYDNVQTNFLKNSNDDEV